MSSYHTPERKSEQAMVRYLQGVLDYELLGVQIATRFENGELTEPRIEIYCDSCSPWTAGPSEIHTGNWMVNMSIKCISHYERGVDAAAHDDIMGAVLDKLLVTDGTSDALTAEINATSTGEDFTVQDVVLKDRTNSIQEHSLVTEQKLEMYIIPSR